MYKLLLTIIEKILPPHSHHFLGDMQEEFEYLLNHKGPARAYVRLIHQIIRSIPYFIFESLIWNSAMLFNYLKVTFRNIKKYKTFSLINVLGLSVSMSICLLIILFIIDQRSFDTFHSNSENIYRVITETGPVNNNPAIQYATSPADIGYILKNEYSGIAHTALIRNDFSGELSSNNNNLSISGFYTEPSFFDVFDFKLVAGNPSTALVNPRSMIISEEQAIRLFGDTNPIGRVLTILQDGDYTITGVIDTDTDYRSHLAFEALVSYSTLTSDPDMNARITENWANNAFSSYVYLSLNEHASTQEIESLFPSIIQRHYPTNQQGLFIQELDLQPVTSINMGLSLSNEIGRVMSFEVLYFLGGLGLVIIIIGCFNYISLSIARSLSRSKEVGVRKVLGAHRSHVFKQFLFEAVIITFTSLFVASAMLKWLVPEFNSLFIVSFTDSQIMLGSAKFSLVYIAFIVFGIIIGIGAGAYPAFYLSSFNPSKVLKGLSKIRGFSAVTLRKMIIVGQFCLSIIFIITSITIYQQYEHMVEADYGFDKEHIINLELQDVPFNRVRDILSQNPDIISISGSSLIPGLNSRNGDRAKTEQMEDYVPINRFSADENYVETMGLNLIAGPGFNKQQEAVMISGVLINEEAIKVLNLEGPGEAIGSFIQFGDSTSHEIIGVIQNFVSARVVDGADPVYIDYAPERFAYANIKTTPGTTVAVSEDISEVWTSLGSAFNIRLNIFSDQLKTSPLILVFGDFIKMIGLVAGFSIFVSCLGLLGMALYSAETRVKEIGVRKVLGAQVSDILILLSKEYVSLIIIAILIATPLSWLINHSWLQEVAIRIQLGPSMFLIGILGTVFIAIITIGSQTIKASRANSIDNLRSE